MTLVINSNSFNSTFNISKDFNMIYDKLKENMGIGICDKFVHLKIATCGFKKYERLLNFITGQTSVISINPTYSMYKINIFSKIPSHHLDLIGYTYGQYYSTIQTDENHLIFNCLNLDSLLLFLLENSKDLTKYIFIPIVYGSVDYNSGHFAVLVFDIIMKNVYFVDPNGKAGFFDDIFYTLSKKNSDPEMLKYMNLEDMYIDTEELLEKMFELYIKNYNDKFGENYKFVKRSIWNQSKFTINKNYDTSEIKSGHCVCVTTLFVDYMTKTYESPDVVINILKKISQNEILELINGYSVGMYNLLTNM